MAILPLACTVMTWALWMGAPCSQRSTGPWRAAPRPIDGPLDVEETAKLASYARDGQQCYVVARTLRYIQAGLMASQ